MIKKPSVKMHQNFIDGLKNKYGIEYNQEFRDTWKYCGGDGGQRANMDLTSARQAHINYWEMLFGFVAYPTKTDECVCGHHIEEQCYITDDINNNNSDFIIIGSCCIKLFLSQKNQGRTCKDCGEPHKNRKDSYCKDCRIKKAYELKRQKETQQAEETKRQLERIQEQVKRQTTMDFWKTTLKTQDKDAVKKCEKCRKQMKTDCKYKQCYTCKFDITPDYSGICEICEGFCNIRFSKCYKCHNNNSCS